MPKLAIAVGFFVASSAFAQLDANTLRGKYGPFLDRETYTVRPGVELVVDYGPSKLACQLRISFHDIKTVKNVFLDQVVPPLNPRSPSAMPHLDTAITKEQIVDDVVPPSVRGAIGTHNGAGFSTGGHVVSIWYYDKLTIEYDSRNGSDIITITMKDSACPTKAAQ